MHDIKDSVDTGLKQIGRRKQEIVMFVLRCPVNHSKKK
jgi:hypothetical protein